jgi:hypothetical protein
VEFVRGESDDEGQTKSTHDPEGCSLRTTGNFSSVTRRPVTRRPTVQSSRCALARVNMVNVPEFPRKNMSKPRTRSLVRLKKSENKVASTR